MAKGEGAQAGGGLRVMLAQRAHIRRYREILHVLARHGLGVLVSELAPGRVPAFAPRLLGLADRGLAPVHLRLALEELGTTFIKAGQILSTRADLLPPAYIRELGRLQDHVPPVGVAQIRQELVEELGETPEALFAQFDETPLASASIGQVHRAVLPDGQRVVVKVQKPGIARMIDVDLAILRYLAGVAATRVLPWGRLDAVALVDEFAWTLRGELDYEREARNAAALARNFSDDPTLRVPRVHGRFTTRRVLVMEEIHGIRIDDEAGLREAGIDPPTLAQRSARILLRSIFEHGLYHADPHPGNFLICRDGSLAALDFGMIGRLDAVLRDALLRAVLAVVQREPTAVVDALEALGIRSAGGDQRPLVREVSHLLDTLSGVPLGEIELAPLIAEVFDLVRRFELQMPADLALLLKTLAMNEGIGRRLDPGFVATEQTAAYLRELALRRIASPRWALQSLRVAGEALSTSARLPRRLERLLLALETGEVRMDATSGFWGRAHREISAVGNRIALAILAAGLVIGAGLLLPRTIAEANPAWLPTAVGAAGGAGVLLTVTVLLSVLRSQR